jgi:hypothetical protein
LTASADSLTPLEPRARIRALIRHDETVSFLGSRLALMYNAAYDCIKAFSESDFTEDLKKIDVSASGAQPPVHRRET